MVHEDAPAISVLCVDDNPQLAEALHVKLDRTPGFRWGGWLPDAGGLVAESQRGHPALVVLDIDMPGRDPFDALKDMTRHCPDTRAVVFSGHVRPDLVEKAVAAGAWGYVSKNDGAEALIGALRAVAGGEFAFSREVRMCSA
jgi:DNA-binding NarL/FixJ family response regulator